MARRFRERRSKERNKTETSSFTWRVVFNHAGDARRTIHKGLDNAP